MKRLRILAAALCVLAAPAYAQVQGQDYELLTPPQPTASADKVEVVEFFSYGCPHCAAMAPHIEKWAAQLPANATFVRVRLNGREVQRDRDVGTPTGHAHVRKEVATGPLLLQGDHGPVAFRNVRIKPAKRE